MLYFEILLILGLTLLNGVLAMSEMAVVSSRPARLRAMAQRNIRGSRRALALTEHPGRFLSSVQIGITLVGVLSGAFSGATLGLRLSNWLEGLGLAEAPASIIGVGVVVSVITYLSLIGGELVPKQLALRNPERIACKVAPAMTTLARFASPVVWLLDKSGQAVLRLLGKSGKTDKGVTEEEIKTLVAEAAHAGVIEPNEREMISGVMRLGDRRVRSVMTPRIDADMIDLTDPQGANLKKIADSTHSRFPVHEGDPGHVLGVVWAKDLIGRHRPGRRINFKSLVKDAPIIPEGMDALDALEILKGSTVHMGLVHDEYGHFLGIVTAADILEAIVGTFRSDEEGEPSLTRREDGSLLISGWMPVEEFAEAVGLKLAEKRSFETVAGFLVDAFGRLPATGESIAIQNWRFEVIDLDGRRIDKILAHRVAHAAAGTGGGAPS